MNEINMEHRKIVRCATTEEFLDTYYKPDRFRGRGEEYAQCLIDSHEKDFQKYGYDLISKHDSVMGISVWRYPEGMQPNLFWFPWCTSAYKADFVREKVKELEESGEYFGVRSNGGYIYVQLAKSPNSIGALDKKEWEEAFGTNNIPA